MPDRVRTLLVFTVALVVLVAGLSTYALWDPDEGRHSAIARELFNATTWRGWIVPSHNFADYHDKPILYYWLTSLAYGVAGVNEVGARLVAVLSALATLGAVFAWTATLWNVRLARRAVLVLTTSAGFMCLGRYGSLDMLLTCWLTLGLFAAERATALPERHVFAAAAGVAAGLGMLTKGLVAPLFIAGIPFLHVWIAGRRIPPMHALLLAASAFIVVAAPWYAAVGIVDPAYLREFFLVHHLERFTSDGTTFHAGPWWYYAPGLALMFFPWSLLVPAAAGATAPRSDAGLRFCWCWAVVVIGFFSCSHGKLATYILPALPPLAIIMAHAIDAIATAPGAALRRLAAGGVAALAVVLSVLVPIALRLHHRPWDVVIAQAAPYLLLFPASAILLLASWWWRGIRGAAFAMATTTFVIVVTFYTRMAPVVSEVVSERALAEMIATHPTAPIVSYQVTPASLLFYSGRPIRRLGRPRELREALFQAPFTWIVTSPRHVEEITRATPAYPWVTVGRHVLYATAPLGAVAQGRSALTSLLSGATMSLRR